MDITTSETDGVCVINVAGRMDATTVTAFNEECRRVLDSGSKRIVIDLGSLEYISSAGLRGVLMMGKACKTAGATLAFCSMQAMVSDMFKLSGFNSILNLYASRDEALAGLR